jgi:hypothetical protein
MCAGTADASPDLIARFKMRGDPVIRTLLLRGLWSSGGEFPALGCGQGCWFAWLWAARHAHEEGAWPVEWPAPHIARVGDSSGGWRYRLANGIDHTVSALRGYRGARRRGWALREWRSLLEVMRFAVRAVTMRKGQPFANVMLVCRRSA